MQMLGFRVPAQQDSLRELEASRANFVEKKAIYNDQKELLHDFSTKLVNRSIKIVESAYEKYSGASIVVPLSMADSSLTERQACKLKKHLDKASRSIDIVCSGDHRDPEKEIQARLSRDSFLDEFIRSRPSLG